MLQFYFLSVSINVLAGYLLFFEEGSALEQKSGLPVRNELFKFVLGIIAALTGLFKILSPIEGDVPVVGDLLSAITCFLCGFILIVEYYRQRSLLGDSDQTEKIRGALVGNKKIVGAAAFIVGVLHFLFPKVLLL